MDSDYSFKIFTFGCKLNQYESQLLRENLIVGGWQEKDEPQVFIINSCAVTSRAENKVRDLVRKIRKNRPSSKIIVCGCMVGLHKNVEGADLLFENQQKNKIVELLTKSSPKKRYISYFEGHSRGFVKVQDGCNNFCSYCIIPYLRGRSRSRKREEILEEVRCLVGNGYREVVLSGVCLGDYGKDLYREYRLVNLLDDVLKLGGNFRIRLSSIEPKDIGEALIDFIAQNPRIARHLHIPFQNGDDFILKKMNRPYTQKDYLELVERVKTKIEDICITTDIIVGFPLEEETPFKNTLDFLKRIRPLKTHIFTYSRRPFVASGKFIQQVYPWQVKQRRRFLEKETSILGLEEKRRFVGKTLEAIMEKRGQALTTNYIRIKLPCEFYSQDLFFVKVVSVDQESIKVDVTPRLLS